MKEAGTQWLTLHMLSSLSRANLSLPSCEKDALLLLSQGYLNSPAYCHNLVSRNMDLMQVSSVVIHYIWWHDDKYWKVKSRLGMIWMHGDTFELRSKSSKGPGPAQTVTFSGVTSTSYKWVLRETDDSRLGFTSQVLDINALSAGKEWENKIPVWISGHPFFKPSHILNGPWCLA